MIKWYSVDTVLLDMDGTLLDLHFDAHFWLEHVPLRLAEKHCISHDDAKAQLYPRLRAHKGTLNWYCVDFWSKELELDIPALKREVDHLIAIHPHVIDFLTAVRKLGKRLVLVTDAHSKVLDLKMQHTQLDRYLDATVSSHDMGTPKEQIEFWEKLQAVEPFKRSSTLFIDDSLPVLRAARDYGIAYLLTVTKPDSQRPARDMQEFRAIESFRDILP
ncbi:MAG: GMP/IMP nucleotidase [Acidiferrobacterales bacterium]